MDSGALRDQITSSESPNLWYVYLLVIYLNQYMQVSKFDPRPGSNSKPMGCSAQHQVCTALSRGKRQNDQLGLDGIHDRPVLCRPREAKNSENQDQTKAADSQVFHQIPLRLPDRSRFCPLAVLKIGSRLVAFATQYARNWL